MIACLCCGVPRYEFSDKEINRMRSWLAKQWKQTVDQVTDYEVVFYLREQRAAQ